MKSFIKIILVCHVFCIQICNAQYSDVIKSLVATNDCTVIHLDFGSGALFNVQAGYLELNSETDHIQWINRTGEPNLPSYVFHTLVPPNVELQAVICELKQSVYREIENTEGISIDPVPPPVTWVDDRRIVQWPVNRNLVNGEDTTIYGKNAFWPDKEAFVLDVSELRKWKMVQIALPLIRYNPVINEAEQFVKGVIVVNYKAKSLVNKAFGTYPADRIGMDRVKHLCFNFNQLSDKYGGGQPVAEKSSGEKTGYTIITTTDIAANSGLLSSFAVHKEAMGFDVQVITEDDFGGGIGDNAAENIRSWLQSNYLEDQIEYVLFIGNPKPEDGDIPMKMLWPNSKSSNYREAPSDFYYADLSGNWDLDNDGLYGERDDDFGPGGIDVAAEVLVGRIPYYGSIGELDSILQKTIDYEYRTFQDDWQLSILLPMEPSDAETPGFHLGESVTYDFAINKGWRSHRIYDEEYGLIPPPETTPTNCNNVTSVWSEDPFGYVLWWTHGGPTGASDIMNIHYADRLNDRYPSFTFQVSCLNSHPETENNLSYTLLTNGGICTIGATRVSWYYPGQTYFSGSPSNSGMGYEYSRRILAYEYSAGASLYELNQLLSNGIWMNKTVFNIYGDPSLKVTSKTVQPPYAESDSVEYGDPVPDLIAVGENIKWYGDNNLENLIYEGDTFSTGETDPGIYTYYVTQSFNGHESRPTLVTLTIYLIVPPPVVEDITIQFGDPTPDFNVTGENIKWYSDPDNPLYDQRDGRTYRVTEIGNYFWMADNLNYYTNEGSWYYNEDSITCSNTYGRLYNWETAQNVCPDGWQIASNVQWDALDVDTFNLKTDGNVGFNGQLAGFRDYYGNYSGAENIGLFWSSSEEIIGSSSAYNYHLSKDIDFGIIQSRGNKVSGLSVRCYTEKTAPVDTGNIFNAGFADIGKYTFYVTQTVSGFESRPARAVLTILPNPPAAEDVSICYGEELPGLYAKGENIRWYDAPLHHYLDKRDGQLYKTTEMNNQIWMAENMNYYTSGGSAYYDYDSLSYAEIYGRLYNWHAAEDICFEGWRLPTYNDIKSLIFEGGAMKEKGTEHWKPPNTGATNETGFTALPAGCQYYEEDGFTGIGEYAYFWRGGITFYKLSYDNDFLWPDKDSDYHLFSVRCLTDGNAYIHTGNIFVPYGSGIGEYTYYVTQTINEIESLSDTVVFTIRSIPAPPVAEDTGACENQELKLLTAEGENIKWYADFDSVTLVDERDGKKYLSVKIGSQWWMAENLNYGVMIDNANEQTDNAVAEKYCYDNAEEYCDTYGGLYQWNELMNYTDYEVNRGICPEGWHIPDDLEWMLMERYLGMNVSGSLLKEWRGTGEGDKLKEEGPLHWKEPNTGATNEIGFTALPGGTRYLDHEFYNLHSWAYFWTSTLEQSGYAYKRNLNTLESRIRRMSADIEESMSVRCVKDDILAGDGDALVVDQDTTGVYGFCATQTIDGCESAPFRVDLIIYPVPVVDLGPDTTINSHQNLLLGVDDAGYSYTWNTGADDTSIMVSGGELGEGIHTYWLIATDSNSCENADTIIVTVINTTSDNARVNSGEIRIYPNPVKDLLIIGVEELHEKDLVITLADQLGNVIYREVYRELIQGENIEIDMSSLTKGVYFIQLRDQDLIIAGCVVKQ